MPVQSEFLVGGAMALLTIGAVVVGALVLDETVDGVDVVAAVLDKTGVAVAVGADGGGPYVPPFFRSSRPVC